MIQYLLFVCPTRLGNEWCHGFFKNKSQYSWVTWYYTVQYLNIELIIYVSTTQYQAISMAAVIGGQKSSTNIFSTSLPPCRVLGSPLPPLQYAFCVGKKKKSVLSASVLFTNFYITDLYQNSSTVRHIPKVPQCKHPSWDSATEKTDNNFRQDSRSEKEDIYCCDTYYLLHFY